MSSLFIGFDYDICISCHRKDEKDWGGVNEFAGAMKSELGSTFNERISVNVYINPYDGRPETNDVDASFKNKLTYLVLINIISRKYFVSGTFTREEYKFMAIADYASKDLFVMKKRLPDGIHT